MRNTGLKGEQADQLKKVLDKDPTRNKRLPNTERNQISVQPLVKLN